MTQTVPNTSTQVSTDAFPMNGTDYFEMLVGNARQSAHFYQTAMGFQPLAYSGLSTGIKDRESYVLQQDKIRLVLTTPLKPGTDIGKLIDTHGDTVRTIALWVDDSRIAYKTAIERGAESHFEPREEKDDKGHVVRSAVKSYGDAIHVFVERSAYDGIFLPGFVAWEPEYRPEPVGLKYVDHMVANVDEGQMNKWVDWYANVLGFKQLISFDDKDISTKYTALMSKVMSNGNGRIKFPINEPAPGLKKSQIEEYLEFHGGAGIQHIAVATDNVVETVTQLRNRGVEFLRVPDTYYDTLLDRVGEIDESIEPLRELGILVDRDDEGYLLQIFTRPIGSRPTVFYEIIQRKGATSFGKGNFKALFEAIEREQEIRGTL
ncbi:MAG: 4-hydroxyphenylpyruvate dioxygenase [Lewinella sp.]